MEYKTQYQKDFAARNELCAAMLEGKIIQRLAIGGNVWRDVPESMGATEIMDYPYHRLRVKPENVNDAKGTSDAIIFVPRPLESVIIKELCKEKEMTPEQLFRQALAFFQLNDIKTKKGLMLGWYDKEGNRHPDYLPKRAPELFKFPIEDTYGYHVFSGQDGDRFMPRVQSDEWFLLPEGKWNSGNADHQRDFSPATIYRRKVVIEKGFRLQDLNECFMSDKVWCYKNNMLTIQEVGGLWTPREFLRNMPSCGINAFRVPVPAVKATMSVTVSTGLWIDVGTALSLPSLTTMGVMPFQLKDGRVLTDTANAIQDRYKNFHDVVRWYSIPEPPAILDPVADKVKVALEKFEQKIGYHINSMWHKLVKETFEDGYIQGKAAK